MHDNGATWGHCLRPLNWLELFGVRASHRYRSLRTDKSAPSQRFTNSRSRQKSERWMTATKTKMRAARNVDARKR